MRRVLSQARRVTACSNSKVRLNPVGRSRPLTHPHTHTSSRTRHARAGERCGTAGGLTTRPVGWEWNLDLGIWLQASQMAWWWDPPTMPHPGTQAHP